VEIASGTKGTIVSHFASNLSTDEQAPTEIKFDHDEEVEKRAEVALARRHRSLTVTEHKPPRF
jgi:hypothetical protein